MWAKICIGSSAFFIAGLIWSWALGHQIVRHEKALEIQGEFIFKMLETFCEKRNDGICERKK